MGKYDQVVQILNTTIGKPIFKNQICREVHLIGLMKNLMSKYPAHYAFTVAKSNAEAELILVEMVSQKYTTAENVVVDLKQFYCES